MNDGIKKFNETNIGIKGHLKPIQTGVRLANNRHATLLLGRKRLNIPTYFAIHARLFRKSVFLYTCQTKIPTALQFKKSSLWHNIKSVSKSS